MPSLTVTAHSGKLSSLRTNVGVCQAFDLNAPKLHSTPLTAFTKFTGIWDTGATNSVITANVVDKCNLVQTGVTTVHTANGTTDSPVFLVNIGLPNRVAIPDIRVTLGDLADVDVLIGMDIITLGDFAITHPKGNTVFSFRLPSATEIDFVKEERGQVPKKARLTVGRNAKCPCGSGKKYKQCCLGK